MRAAQIITTVVTPASSCDLTTVAAVKSDWGITDAAADGFLTRAITRCSKAAANFCNRDFALETVTDQIYLARDGLPCIVRGDVEAMKLSRWPIIAVASVTEAGTVLVAGTDFLIDAEPGLLVRLDTSGDPTRWCSPVVVTYSAGYWLTAFSGTNALNAPDLPEDIEDAVSRMVYTRYAERQRDPLVKSEYVDGVGRTEYLVPSANGNMSPDVADLLENYRAPVIV